MNYPAGMKKTTTAPIQYSNRGMSLEHDLNATNEYYRVTNRAIIYKKPTPVTIVKVDYKSRRDAVIKEGYFKTPSTTDYNGIYRGKYIDFEAKETRNKRFFPLSNIHVHQIDHLKKITEHGGIGFLIVRFSTLNLTYFLDSSKLLTFTNEHTRSSIPLTFFEEHGYRIYDKFNPRLDYLAIVDLIYFGGKSYE
ncbi:MAG: Holliday junction resolvase RecU [Bacilli bacterium]|jgi:recombination protein U|nr:Holliday junction resolvase RecU [Bacilli bacterium]